MHLKQSIIDNDSFLIIDFQRLLFVFHYLIKYTNDIFVEERENSDLFAFLFDFENRL